MTCREAVYKAAKMCVPCLYAANESIYLTHGESTKDKEFELEMTWISTSETNNLHQPVPKDLLADAETQAKKDDEDEEMGDAQ
jgi:20S proteasome subunit alpha 7